MQKQGYNVLEKVIWSKLHKTYIIISCWLERSNLRDIRGKKHFIWRQAHCLQKKKRMTVHYKSWFIAGSWKYSRKKSGKIITHACEIGNKYYLKGLLTQITVLSKLRPHSEMMRPFLATRCCCRHLHLILFFNKVNFTDKKKKKIMKLWATKTKVTDHQLINAQSCILWKWTIPVYLGFTYLCTQ